MREFGAQGYEVVCARDGAEALEMLHGDPSPTADGSPFKPSVVILDLKLPKIDGLTVLQRIRENEATKLLPVVVLTSSDEQDDIIRSYKIGVNSYVRKPVDFKEFIESVGNLGLYWLIVNELPREGE